MKNDAFIPQMEPLIGKQEVTAVTEYLESGGWLTEHKKTAKLSTMLVEYTGAKHCVILANGTVTLFASLYALGINSGDEVVVPDITMIATPNAARLAGATPVLCDVNPRTGCLDASTLERVITNRTKAVFLVSLNGRFPGDIDEIENLCSDKNIFIIEDAAQSLGSFANGKHIGRFGVFGSFSFAMHKIITMGQGGALITDNDELASKISMIKNFGRKSDGIDIHSDIGWNFKCTDLQAVVGIEQLKQINQRITRKKEMFHRYKERLTCVKEVEFMSTQSETCPMFVDCFVEKRDELIEYLKQSGIGSRSLYPPIHTQAIYSGLDKNFPVACFLGKKGVWLPSSLKNSDSDIDFICDRINSFYN